MNANEFDYYFIGSTYPDNVPLLTVDDIDRKSTMSIGFLSRNELVPENHVARVRFGAPIPRKPKLADYFSLDGTDGVFSRKVYDALKEHNIKGLQLVPTIIRGKKDELHKDFWVANIYQRLTSFDKDKSEFGYFSDFTNEWQDIEKIVLDKEALSKIPLEDRLVYTTEESAMFVVYHKSIVDIIMSVEPEGVCFTPVEEWNDGSQFDLFD